MRTRLALSLLLLAVNAPATTITVDLSGYGDYLTIQEGIDAASYGDTVEVACGTYPEHDIVMKSGVCLRSETGQPECVTVDAEGLGRVLSGTGADSTTVIEGLTIARGYWDSTEAPYDGGGMYWVSSSPRIINCEFVDNEVHDDGGYVYGGAVAFHQSSPVVVDCIFSGNTAVTTWPHAVDYGGAISLRYSDSRISGCEFQENHADEGGGIYARDGRHLITHCDFIGNSALYGGGAEIGGWSLQLTIEDCLFFQNDAGHGGGAIFGPGSAITRCTFTENTSGNVGGMECQYDCVITDCTFADNTASSSPGGVWCGGPSTFERCTISGNRSLNHRCGGIWLAAGELRQCVITGNTADRRGGGVICGSNYAGTTDIIGCVIADNHSGEFGGGVVCEDTLAITIVGCTISGNSAAEGGGAVAVLDDARPTIENSILSFSATGGAALCDSTGSLSLLCCDVFGNEGGDWTGCIEDQEFANGNFSLDPLFCGMYEDDFTLCANSPCLPTVRVCSDTIGALGQGCSSCDSPVEGALFVSSCDEGSVTLRWNVQGLAGFVGLNVYRASGEGGSFARLSSSILPAVSPGSYTDESVWPGTTFRYALKAVGIDGSEEGVGDVARVTTPGEITAALLAPRPNPFGERCSISVDLPTRTRGALVGVFDVAGRLVATLHDGPLSRGRHVFEWSGCGDDGIRCAVGVYFVRCRTEDLKLGGRVILLR